MQTGRGLSWAAVGGAAACAAGVLFHLQGLSLAGPESSFMYGSPQWEAYGLQVASAGAAVSALALLLRRSRPRPDSPA